MPQRALGVQNGRMTISCQTSGCSTVKLVTFDGSTRHTGPPFWRSGLPSPPCWPGYGAPRTASGWWRLRRNT